MIRKCPHCLEIWMKVEGCNGQTKCGQRGWSKGWVDSADTQTMKVPTASYKFKFTKDHKFQEVKKTGYLEKIAKGFLGILGFKT